MNFVSALNRDGQRCRSSDGPKILRLDCDEDIRSKEELPVLILIGQNKFTIWEATLRYYAWLNPNGFPRQRKGSGDNAINTYNRDVLRRSGNKVSDKRFIQCA